MNYLQRAYLEVIRQKDLEDNYNLKPYERSRTIGRIERTFENDCFPAMLKDGGTKTEYGVIYKDFEYRSEEFRDDSYYRDALAPCFKEMGYTSVEDYYTQIGETINIDKVLEAVENFCTTGKLNETKYQINIDDFNILVSPSDTSYEDSVKGSFKDMPFTASINEGEKFNRLASNILGMNIYGEVIINNLDYLDTLLMHSNLELRKAELITSIDEYRLKYPVNKEDFFAEKDEMELADR